MVALFLGGYEIYNRKLYKKIDCGCCSKQKKRTHAPINMRKEREEWLKKQ